MSHLAFWMLASRAPFLSASLMSVLLGAVTARASGALLPVRSVVLTVMGVALLHLGVNLINDYYDHRQGTDRINQRRTRYNGGSGVVQAGLASQAQVARAALTCMLGAGIIGVWLAVEHGPLVWLLIVIGLVLGVGYSAPPLQLMGTGWGELVAGLCCGPLVALGAHHVAGGLSYTGVWLASVPAGLLVSAILVINELPDYQADRATGKANLVVRLGPQAGVQLHRALIVVAYGWVAALLVSGRLPISGLVVSGTIPLAWWSLQHARRHAAEIAQASPSATTAASAGTVGLHTLVSLLLAACYLW